MCGPTLFFTPIKICGPISVNLREKRRKEKIKISPSLSLQAPSLPKMPFLFYFIILLLLLLFSIIIIIIIIWIYDPYYLIRVCFYPETIYFFSIQFILNELSSSHFLTSEIFVKISSLKSLTTYHPENRKNIPIVS